MVLDDDLGHAGQPLEGRDGDTVDEAQLDLVMREITQRLDPVDLHQTAVADDGHPVARPLDLGQDVAGQEDGPALGARLAHQLVERLLDERIEPGCRFVEDEQLGAVLEGDDQPDLLLVALGVLLEPPRRVEIEALDQRGLVGRVDAAAQVGEVLDGLPPGEAVV